MNTRVIFALEGNELLADKLSTSLHLEKGLLEQRRFPDGETYLRILSDVQRKEVIVVCTLNDPDPKLLSLFFLSKTLKELGAKKITLVAPYLAYMRQDKIFNEGEALTSGIFAKILCGIADEIITVDPHLHRRKNMDEIYSIPSTVLYSAPLISVYIRENVEKPLLIGPDSESEQWVSEVAKGASAPFVILQKTRLGDRNVKVSIPDVEKFTGHTPVLVDDIISTARTMIETIKHLQQTALKKPVCIATHGIFAGTAHEDLLRAGAAKIVTCNTVMHQSNQIDISGLIDRSLVHK